MSNTPVIWPVLDWTQWQSTADTLHMLMQIVGKTRLALTPLRNHWWNVPLYVSARGLTTSAMSLPDGDLLEIEFDFLAHELNCRRSSGSGGSVPLGPGTVADFYAAYRRVLANLAVDVSIDRLPVECENPIRFDRDTVHASYDADAAQRFWRVLGQVRNLFDEFSAGFVGKISPVHFFWGSMDLAVTRFSGRRAPPRPGADPIQAEAYSHECISAGFWAGNGGYGQAAFYCYAAPVPPRLAGVTLPGKGAFDHTLGEFLLNYAEVRQSADPARMVRDFLDDTYSACAELAGWDRVSLSR